jgi:guanylate kinase
MGKLIILSGPSCVGKGPLVKTLEIYLKTRNKKLVRHVLYNTRPLKKNEVHEETYLYTFLWNKVNGDWRKKNVSYDRNSAIENLGNIATRANKKGECFDIFIVGNDLQGLNFSTLKKELEDKKNAVVLLEIYQDKVDDVVAFCKRNEFDVKRIFVSPLTEGDYEERNCIKEEDRAKLTQEIMLEKLTLRARDSQEDMIKRAGRAYGEIVQANTLKKQNKIHILTNHFGEGVKEWDALQKRAGSKPECDEYGAKVFTLTGEIDKMFRQFLDLVFP